MLTINRNYVAGMKHTNLSMSLICISIWVNPTMEVFSQNHSNNSSNQCWCPTPYNIASQKVMPWISQVNPKIICQLKYATHLKIWIL